MSNQNIHTLLNFSLGKIDDLQAMETLGIESTEDLFLLIVQAHLPMPHLSDNVTQEMIEVMNALPLAATPVCSSVTRKP